VDRLTISADDRLSRRLLLALATVGGLGYLPWMPGTWASLATLGLVWLLSQAGMLFYLTVLLTFFFLGVHVSSRTERLLGHRDPGLIVIDEVVGQLVALAGQPMGWWYLLWGWALFRAMDILKPFPINRIDSHGKGGWGIMLDDVVAGVYAWLGLHLLQHIFPCMMA